jgi:hypothetical protein
VAVLALHSAVLTLDRLMMMKPVERLQCSREAHFRCGVDKTPAVGSSLRLAPITETFV